MMVMGNASTFKREACKLILSNREIERRPVIGHGAFIFHFDLFIKSPTSGRLISSRDYQCPPPQKKSSHLFSRRNQINNSVTHIVQHNAHKDVERNAKEVHYGAS